MLPAGSPTACKPGVQSSPSSCLPAFQIPHPNPLRYAAAATVRERLQSSPCEGLKTHASKKSTLPATTIAAAIEQFSQTARCIPSTELSAECTTLRISMRGSRGVSR